MKGGTVLNRAFIVFVLLGLLSVCVAPPALADFTIQGTVTVAGRPVQNAVVGVKTGPVATADADVVVNPGQPGANVSYFVTDAGGHYGPSAAIPAATYYVGAWADGYGMVETQVVLDTDKTVDIAITKSAGANMAPGKTVFWGSGTDIYSHARRINDGGRYGGDSAAAFDGASGTSTAISPTVLTDHSRLDNPWGPDPWTTNIWAGVYTLKVTHGGNTFSYPIASNTAETITIASGNMVANGIVAGDTYKVVPNTSPLRPMWMGVDLGANTAVKEIVVDYFVWLVPYNYKIQYAVDDGSHVMPAWDSASWLDWYSAATTRAFGFPFQGDSGPWEAISAPEATGRWWKISSTDGPKGWGPEFPIMGVRELEIYSTADFTGQVMGVVKNAGTLAPIYDAAVQIGGGYGNAMVTGTDGLYSLTSPSAGSKELFGDAPGYTSKAETVVLPADGTILVKNILLNSATETGGIYNGDFEIQGSGGAGTADGWEVFANQQQGNDALGNPYPPPNPDMYLGTRDATQNSTPGGSAAGWLATGNAHPNPGVGSIETHPEASDWHGAVGSPVTQTIMTDSTQNWQTNGWTGCFLHITHAGGGDHLYKILSNTNTTITIESGDMVADGVQVGDAFEIQRYHYLYWYMGGIRITADKLIPVDETSVYSLYFKAKRSGDCEHFYGFVWRRADGSEISRAYNWWWWPGTTWTQVLTGVVPGRDGWTPMLRMAPPTGAAFIEVQIGYTQWGWDWPSKPVTTFIDDVVVDAVPLSDVGRISGTVTLAGVPHADAVVGVKKTPSATSDADYYYLTDSNGHFQTGVLSTGTWYVATWIDGYQICEKTVNVTSGVTNVTLDVRFVQGFNKALHAAQDGGPSPGGLSALDDGYRYGGDYANASDDQGYGYISSVTSTVLTDLSKSWATDQFAGYQFRVMHVVAGVRYFYTYTIASNTGTDLTIAYGDMLADGVAPGDLYWIIGYQPRPVWMSVDLGENHPVKQVLIDYMGFTVPGRYKIQCAVDDGGGMPPPPESPAWTDWYVTTGTRAFTFPGMGDSGPYEAINMPLASARWWRIWSDNPPSVGDPPIIPQIGVKELEIYSAIDVPGALSGIVKDTGGHPIYNAMVHVDGAKTALAVTDTNGAFVFTQLPTDQGPYWLAADALGYAPSEVQVTLLPGEIKSQDITLTARAETGAYNADMELSAGQGVPPAGWSAYPVDAPYEDYYRYTGDNHTPGGGACYAVSRQTGPTGNNVAVPCIAADKYVPVSQDKAYNVYFWARAVPDGRGDAWSVIWRDAAGNEINRIIPPGWFMRYGNTWKGYPLVWKAVPPGNAAYLDVHVVLVFSDNEDPSRRFLLDDVVVDETTCPSNPPSNRVGDAKTMLNQEVSLYSKIVTAVAGGGIPEGFAYIEEGDRSSGVLVGVAGAVRPDLYVGQIVNVAGLVVDTPEGERCITAEVITAPDQGEPSPPGPLGMTVRSASTADLAPGLLVSIAGRWIFDFWNHWLDDGTAINSAPTSLSVVLGTLGDLQPFGSFVRATGIVSIGSGGERVLRIRTSDDVIITPTPPPGP
jgi:hypothetical protein